MRPLYWLRGKNPNAAFVAHRLSNFEIVRRFVDEIAVPRDEPVLIVGDMNTCRTTETDHYAQMLAILDARAPDAATGHSATFCPTTNAFASGGGAKWLDHVLWSRSHLQPVDSRMRVRLLRSPRGWRSHRLGRRLFDLSDHYALWGRFTFD